MKFIYGQEGYLIDSVIKKIIKDSNVEPSIYDESSLLEDIIMDISTIGFFSTEKLIVIKNHPILVKGENAQKLVDLISNIDDNIILIFTLETKKIETKNILIKYLVANVETKKCEKIADKDIILTIKKIVKAKGGEISNLVAIKLAGKLPNDLRVIVNEIEKLLLESSTITEEMIEVSIGDYLKENAFELSNAITSNNAFDIMNAYKNCVNNGDETTVIISQISSIFNLALLVSSYRKQGLSNQDIADKTKIHIFRIKKSVSLYSASSIEKIEKIIIGLAKLDKDIKTGLVDKEKGLEYFLLKLIR